MTGVPAVLLLLTLAAAITTTAVPALGSAVLLFATLTAATAWRQYARRNQQCKALHDGRVWTKTRSSRLLPYACAKTEADRLD